MYTGIPCLASYLYGTCNQGFFNDVNDVNYKVIRILQHTSVFLRNCFLAINTKKTGNNMKKVNKFC